MTDHHTVTAEARAAAAHLHAVDGVTRTAPCGCTRCVAIRATLAALDAATQRAAQLERERESLRAWVYDHEAGYVTSDDLAAIVVETLGDDPGGERTDAEAIDAARALALDPAAARETREGR